MSQRHFHDTYATKGEMEREGGREGGGGKGGREGEKA
jgi:hypothetical protein